MKASLPLIAVIFSLSLSAQTTTSLVVLEDGKSPKMNRWSVEGPNASDARIEYVANEAGAGSAVKLTGAGLFNSFVFKGEMGFPLSVKDKVLQWKMKYKVPFMVDVEVSTSDGTRHLVYSDLNEKVAGNDEYIHLGLGSRLNDGNWHTVTRDVQEDLSSVLKKIVINNIISITFKGSGFINDIRVMNKKPLDTLITNAKSGSKNWQVLGRTGKFNIEHDKSLGPVFKFEPGTKDTVFQLKRSNGWNLALTPILQWKIKKIAECKIYVIVETTNGSYILVYEENNKGPQYEAKTKMIHYIIPDYFVDNKWSVVNRDISKDIKNFLPNIDVVRIGSILLKGKGELAEIRLVSNEILGANLIKGWEIYDNDPKSSTIKAVNDMEKGEAVEFFGASLKNGYRYAGKSGTLSESNNKPFIKWDMRFSEVFDVMAAIESDGVVRYIHYVSMPTNYIRIKDRELYIGLGETTTDRRWRTFVRNLSDDMKLLVSDGTYTSCKYVLVRGSGRISNIQFFDKLPEQDKKERSSASASVAIGQHDFGHVLKNIWGTHALKNNGLSSPNAVALDPRGTIYVSDSANNRIMVWGHVPETFGVEADLVFKKDLKNPSGLFVIKNQLFVADTGNDRILVFNLPLEEDSVPKLKIDENLKGPRAVFSDGTNLFVADTENNRILIWNYIPTKRIKNFDVVLGQAGVSGSWPNQGKDDPSYSTMSAPSGIYSDGKSLYVADKGNNRVLVFKEIPTMNGWHADEVIGQEGFTESQPNKGDKASALSLKGPENVLVNDGKLYICDTGNNRILIFNDQKELTSAAGVIGQINFSSSGVNAPQGAASSYTLFAPTSIFIKDGIIYVSDKGNNRVLVY